MTNEKEDFWGSTFMNEINDIIQSVANESARLRTQEILKIVEEEMRALSEEKHFHSSNVLLARHSALGSLKNKINKLV